MPHEVIVVDNRSADSTVAVVKQFMKDRNRCACCIRMRSRAEFDYGLNHATGDVLGRFVPTNDPPSWVGGRRHLPGSECMGAHRSVMCYDMPSRHFGLPQ